MKAVKTIYEEAAYRKGKLGEGSLVMRLYRITPDGLPHRAFYTLETNLETDTADHHYDNRELEILCKYRDSDAIRSAIRAFDFELTQLECYVEDHGEPATEAEQEPASCPQCDQPLAAYSVGEDDRYWTCENPNCQLLGGIIDLDALEAAQDDDIPF